MERRLIAGVPASSEPKLARSQLGQSRRYCILGGLYPDSVIAMDQLVSYKLEEARLRPERLTILGSGAGLSPRVQPPRPYAT